MTSTARLAVVVIALALLAGLLVRGPHRRVAAAAPASPYSRWSQGPSPDPGYLPLCVWLQAPQNAAKYAALGINTYVGLWKGPTEEQLDGLRDTGIRVICDQNEVGRNHRDDPLIMAWMHGDEPDNAQPRPEGGWGPAIPTQRIIDDYHNLVKQDPTRPVLLNLGQGVANDEWIGRGCKMEDYPEYVKGCDIVSFDVYPVVGIRKPDGENYLWYVPEGVTRLREWTNDEKIVWNCIECTRISNLEKKPTPHQVRAEVWMSLIHGSTGIIYFCHQFQPNFIEAALLADPEMSEAVKAINTQILGLAPVLNSPTVADAVTVESSQAEVPIAAMVKQHGGAAYVFAVGMRNGAARGTFQVKGLRGRARAEVLGENRALDVTDGRFADDFAAYDVHLYRIPGAQ